MSTQFNVKRPRQPGKINLRTNIEVRVHGRQVLYRVNKKNRLPFNSMQPGDNVFMPGYTTDPRKEPGLRQLNMTRYNENNTKVWTVRSTADNGVRGVRVFRVA
jgi:hypothetical protein